MPALTDLSSTVRAQLEHELREHEPVLWATQPLGRLVLRGQARSLALAGAITIVGLACQISGIVRIVTGRAMTIDVLLGAVLPAPLVVAGAIVLLSAILAGTRASRTVVALTPDRLLQVSWGRGRRVTWCSLRQIVSVTRDQHADGTGDIEFTFRSAGDLREAGPHTFTVVGLPSVQDFERLVVRQVAAVTVEGGRLSWLRGVPTEVEAAG